MAFSIAVYLSKLATWCRQLQSLPAPSREERTVFLAVGPVGWLQTVAELHLIGDPEASVSYGQCETPDFNSSHP